MVARYLGPADYGKYTLAFAYLAVLGVLADVGLYTTVVREISRRPERTAELVGNAMTIRLLLSLGVIGLAAGISLLLPYPADTRVAVLIAGIALLLGLLSSSLAAVLQARLMMDRAALADVAGRAVSFGAVVVVASLDLGFYAVVGTAALGALVTLIATTTIVRRLEPLRFRAQLPIWRELIVTSIPLGVALAINDIYLRADTFIISLYRSFEEVGFYSLAFRMLELVTTLPQVLLMTIFPLLSRYAADADPRTRGTLQTAFDVLVAFGAPVALGGFVLAPHLVELAAGSGFDDAAVPLRILLVAGALSFVNGLFGFALLAADRQLDVLRLNAVVLALNVALNLALVPSLGIDAAAATAIASEGALLAGYAVLMRRRLAFTPRLSRTWRALLAATAMAAPLWIWRDAAVALLLPLGGLLYAAALWAVGGVDRSLLRQLRRSGA